ncbi:MAG: site-specific integrase [Marmoricola sp.]
MASIAKRPDGQWRARFRDTADREHAKHFPRKIDAQQWLDRQTASIVRGDYVDPGAGKENLGQHAAAWLDAQPLRPSSRYNYESHIRRHIYPTFAQRQLASIMPSEVQAWVSRLVQGDPVRQVKPLAASTAGVVHSILFSIMTAAVLDRKIRANPCATTKLPKDERIRRVVPMTTEQTQALRAAMPGQLRAAVTLAAGTGMRQSEIFGLTIDRIDFPGRTVTVDRQVLTTPGHGPAFGPPKTKASVRSIPLPDVVSKAVTEHLAQFPPLDSGDFVGLVFHRHGGPWTRQAFGHIWRPAIRAAGLPPRTGSHALRHYYASLLIRHSESVKTVQARLGHASASETLDTYSHLWPDSDDRTREAVDMVLGNLADFLRTDGVPEQ